MEKENKEKSKLGFVLKAGAILLGSAMVFGVAYVLFNKPSVGKNSPRSIYRADGKPKVAFDTPQRANFQALKQLIKYGELCHPYRIGDKYYTGHRYAA
jgi:hypothetical protein